MSSFKYTHEYSCSVQKIQVRTSWNHWVFPGQRRICMLLRMKNIQVYSCLCQKVSKSVVDFLIDRCSFCTMTFYYLKENCLIGISEREG
ncbi:hypothetical protein K435DRAFT_785155, partial [Dendrothele bispora CBS 962.96]